MFTLLPKTATSWGAFKHSGDIWKKNRGAPEVIFVACFLRSMRQSLSLFFFAPPEFGLPDYCPRPLFFPLAWLPLISQLLGFLFQVTPIWLLFARDILWRSPLFLTLSFPIHPFPWVSLSSFQMSEEPAPSSSLPPQSHPLTPTFIQMTVSLLMRCNGAREARKEKEHKSKQTN